MAEPLCKAVSVRAGRGATPHPQSTCASGVLAAVSRGAEQSSDHGEYEHHDHRGNQNREHTEDCGDSVVTADDEESDAYRAVIRNDVDTRRCNGSKHGDPPKIFVDPSSPACHQRSHERPTLGSRRPRLDEDRGDELRRRRWVQHRRHGFAALLSGMTPSPCSLLGTRGGNCEDSRRGSCFPPHPHVLAQSSSSLLVRHRCTPLTVVVSCCAVSNICHRELRRQP